MRFARCSLLLPIAAQLLLAVPAAPQQPSGDRFAGARASIRQMMEEHDLPSVSVAVARDGRIVWEEAFGWVDLEGRVPATPETMYSLASISKPMTATALMRLVERGEVDLDRPANDYLAAGRLHSEVWDPSGATVRRVLSHTSGLPLHWEFFYEGEGHPPRTTDEGIERFGVLVTPPGEVYQYSNLGYGVLDRIIERVSGRDYAEFMRSAVFEPLGMTRSRVSTGAGLGSGAAVRYDAENRPIPPYDFDHRGGSAVYSSARDLVRFGMYHLGHRVRDQHPILSDSMRRAMQRIATPDPGLGEQGYGLGWLVMEDDHGFRRVSHTGGMPGVSTALHLYPEEDVAVAVLINRGGVPASRIAQEIAGAMMPRYAEALRARQATGEPPGESRFVPPPELLGRWSGVIHTPGESVPLSLVFQADGDVHARLGEGLVTLLNDASLEDGRLVGRFAGTLPAEDIRRHPHLVQLDLRLRAGALAGSATGITTGSPAYFALSSYAELRRDGEPD
jgi:CubicO group peptidase (beta-lactamase class C family)